MQKDKALKKTKPRVTAVRGNMVIDLGVYPFTLMVSIAQSNEEFGDSIMAAFSPEILKDLDEDQDESILRFNHTTSGRTVHLIQSGVLLVRIKSGVVNPTLHNVLAHEIFHVVEMLFDKLNTPLTRNSAEPYAYLIGYITEQVYKHFKL